MNTRSAYLSIILGAALWGIIGVFITGLYELGFTPVQVVALRVTCSALILGLYVFGSNRELLRFKAADGRYFIGTGIVSIVFFNLCFFNAMRETSISVATILLYTAPLFVTLLSRFIFKERLAPKKLAALLLTFVGCGFVIGIVPTGSDPISFFGLMLGLGAGFFYALYSIFGKFALRKYDSLAVTLYTFVFAAVAIAPFSGLWTEIHRFGTLQAWLNILGLCLLSTILAFLFYTKGLSRVESGKASIMATLEPVVATVAGFLVFNELLTVWQYAGITMVIAAIIMMNIRSKHAGRTAR